MDSYNSNNTNGTGNDNKNNELSGTGFFFPFFK